MNFGVLSDTSTGRNAEEVEGVVSRLAERAYERGHSRTHYADDWSVTFVVAAGDPDALFRDHEGLLAEAPNFIADVGGTNYWRYTAVDGSWVGAGADALPAAVTEILEGFDTFLDYLEADEAGSNAGLSGRLQLEVETFVYLWTSLAPDLDLSPDDRRTGDALAAMAAEVVTSDDPPLDVLKAAFRWFSRKAEHFVDDFIGAAAKSTGATAGVAVTAAATGRLSDLANAVQRVMSVLGA